MGFDDCFESGMLLRGPVQIIVVCWTEVGYRPVTLPIRGSFDREEGIDVFSPTAIANAARGLIDEVGFGREESPRELGELLDMLHRSAVNARLGEREVSVTLIEENVFSAVVAHVEESSPSMWSALARKEIASLDAVQKPTQTQQQEREALAQMLAGAADPAPRVAYADLLQRRSDPRGVLLAALPALDAMSLDDLFALVLPIPETRPLYGELRASAEDELRRQVIELARFLAWTSIGPSYFDHPAFYGVWPICDPAEATSRCARAREKYADLELLLDAVTSNELGWRFDAGELDDDD